LDCVLYSGETHTCSNITHLDPLSDVLLKILETLFPPSYCCALIGELSSGPNYTLTILSSGPDIGPYNIFYISTTGGITSGAQNVAKSAFISPGYSINVPIGTQYIRLQSVNPNCSYYDFSI
jgi:hypothetical protein